MARVLFTPKRCLAATGDKPIPKGNSLNGVNDRETIIRGVKDEACLN